MAADGSYYWVLAVVTPIAAGFLSIRLKPSSDFLKPVAALYVQLRQTEADVEAAGEGHKAAMDKSRGQLMAALSSLGFENYDQFMLQVLVAEVSSRKRLVSGGRAGGRGATGASGVRASGCVTLTVEVGSLFEGLGALLELDKALAQEAAFIRELSRELHVLSLNAQIRAASLGSDGQTLQVVAEQMSGSARATSASAGDICACLGEANTAVRVAASQIATSHLSVEMMSDFVRELERAGQTTHAGGVASAAETRHRVAELAEVVTASLDATGACLLAAGGQLLKLRQRLDDFLKEIRTLQILHVTGRVESVRCQQGEEVAGIFEEVFAKTTDARAKLTLLASLVDSARIEPPRHELIRQTLTALVG